LGQRAGGGARADLKRIAVAHEPREVLRNRDGRRRWLVFNDDATLWGVGRKLTYRKAGQRGSRNRVFTKDSISTAPNVTRMFSPGIWWCILNYRL